ncbi:RNA demethylase ALKBH5 isoform B [Glycine soja]|uniref:RNA demethylase ALKBH5 isoform B n=1 Tax=Glycine soja TaxID=3848 RepID=A0A445H4C6_GLYSO|nr:RNA demethylase ALKBH5 isoform B [Glycine soja]
MNMTSSREAWQLATSVNDELKRSFEVASTTSHDHDPGVQDELGALYDKYRVGYATTDAIISVQRRKEAEYLLFFLCSLYFLSAFLSSPIPPSELTQCAMDDQEQHRQPQPNSNNGSNADPFLLNYSTSDLRTASEFLATWLPFLSRDLCTRCTLSLSDRIRSIDPGEAPQNEIPSDQNDVDVEDNCDNCDAHSLGSWKDGAEVNNSNVETPSQRISWADMAQEDDEFGDEEDSNNGGNFAVGDSNAFSHVAKVVAEKPTLPREQREYIRFMNVRRKKDFICFERVNGKLVNILEGLELHTGIFSAAEQKRIVNYVASLQEMGRKGELKEQTFSAPQKWMRGKGRQTIQFGCCYNYAVDRDGNPPGILGNGMVDPIPALFKVIIRRLIKWHVLPPTCVPDSCIVNIYEEGDCIPPHIDNHDFVRPFCTVSFLSECNIVFGSNLKIVGPGEFDGSIAIPLPMGSVLVLNGNGADVAKHCVPAVPTKRISITFRRMDVSKRPFGYVPEPDLQGIQPLAYEVEQEKKSSGHRPSRHTKRHKDRRGGGRNDAMGSATRNDRFLEPHDSNLNSPRSATRNDRFSEPRDSNLSSSRSANRWSRKPGS